MQAVGRAVALAAALAQAPACLAAGAEQWTAYSKTAIIFTGNVTFTLSRITFGNGQSLSLAPAGTIPGYSTIGRKTTASLYRVTAPANPVLLNGTRLRSGNRPRPVTFIAIARLPAQPPVIPALIAMDVFSGSQRAGGQGGCCPAGTTISSRRGGGEPACCRCWRSSYDGHQALYGFHID